MSYLKQVMEMLELEDMEEFEVNESTSKYRFNLSNGKVEFFDGYFKKWYTSNSLFYLINGTYTIKREWKPKYKEEYFTVEFTEEDLFTEYFWDEDKFDLLLFNNNLVFKTKDEAIECAKKMLEAIK